MHVAAQTYQGYLSIVKLNDFYKFGVRQVDDF